VRDHAISAHEANTRYMVLDHAASRMGLEHKSPGPQEVHSMRQEEVQLLWGLSDLWLADPAPGPEARHSVGAARRERALVVIGEAIAQAAACVRPHRLLMDGAIPLSPRTLQQGTSGGMRR
jgi:hypothetical protein